MPVLGQAQMVHGRLAARQQFLHLRTPSKMCAMSAPSRDHLIGPQDTFVQNHIVIRADGVFGLTHQLGAGFAPGKDTGDLNPPEAQGAGTALASLDRWVVFDFRRF